MRHADGRLIGDGRVETAPEVPGDITGRYAFALMSCNQPFKHDGRVNPTTGQMLGAALTCIENHHVKYALLMGDQMYADMPAPLSLFNPDYFATIAPDGKKAIQECTAQEVRQLYHRRYRQFWNLPGFKRLRSALPCYPILDDHDIIDNWGSDPEHQEEKWGRFINGALLAYMDYQGAPVLPVGDRLPDSFDYTFSYGPTATYVLDLRSNRLAGKNGRIFSDHQEAGLKRFLNTRMEPILFIVLSVPVIHLPRWFSKVMARIFPEHEDFSDRWSTGAHIRDRDRVLEMIHAHQSANPAQRIILLSGDIHIGCVHQIRFGSRVVYQMVSSPITHTNHFLVKVGAKWLIRSNRRYMTRDGRLQGKIRLLRGGKEHTNPYGGLNIGLVEIEPGGQDYAPKFRFLLYGHQNGRPRCVFRSPWI